MPQLAAIPWWVVAAGIAAAAWFLYRSLGGKKPSAPAALPSGKEERQVRVPVLPPGVEAQIEKSLSDGQDPDEDWDPSGRWSMRFQSVAGESFNNDSGTSRQDILRAARPGQKAFLLPEPNNRFDPDAVAVYVETGGDGAAQIGYLPKGNDILHSVNRGKVAAWLARVGAPRHGAPLGAVLYVVVDEA